MKTALVTGGTGFLGQNLVQQLIDKKVQVVVFDLRPSKASMFNSKKVHLIEGDILDRQACNLAIPEKVDAVFHLAGNTSHWKYGDDLQTRINVIGTKNIVEVALKKKANRFIHTSSIAAFGFQPDTITEQSDSTAKGSGINYFRTKYLAELEVQKGIKKGLDAVILNPANIIGPYDSSGWSRMFFLIDKGKLAGAPPGSASFCHVHEVAKAHITAVEKGRCGHNYLLGGADETWLEFTNEIGSILGRKTPNRPVPSFVLKTLGRLSSWISGLTGREPDVTTEKALLVSSDLVCTSNKAIKELGFSPVPLKAMLEDCYTWLVREKLI